MDKGPAVPRLFRFLAIAMFLLGAALFVYNWIHYPVGLSPYLILMVIGAVVSEHYAPTIGGHSASVALPLAVAAMTLSGPCAAAVVLSLAAIRRDSLSSKRLLVVTLFNSGQYSVMFGVSGMLYTRLGGPVLDGETMRHLVSSDFPRALMPMVVGIAVATAINLAITGLGVAALYQMRARDAIAGVLPHGPSLVALGFVGYLIAQVVASSPFALPLFLFPLMLARQLYQRYAAMKDAYLDTVRSLVGALEAKDPYTRGHSERVAEYAVLLGRKLGHDERTIDMLEKSALLHDIGKLALSSALLVKASRLTTDEFEAMRRHPAIGAEMIQRIPPLRSLAVQVGQHHEWFDGAGYPESIAGGNIHPLARILSVADAFDAMTTTRAYRPAMNTARAVTELLQGSGTQFDPTLVGPFVEMLHQAGGPLAAEERDCLAAGAAPAQAVAL